MKRKNRLCEVGMIILFAVSIQAVKKVLRRFLTPSNQLLLSPILAAKQQQQQQSILLNDKPGIDFCDRPGFYWIYRRRI